MSLLLFYGGSGTVPTSGYVLTVDGVEKTMLRDWEIHATANGRAVMRFRVTSFGDNAGVEPPPASGAFMMSLAFLGHGGGSGGGGATTYRPDLDQEVLLTEDGSVLFGGLIESLRESGVLGDAGDPGWEKVTTEVIARDFNTLATRRYFSGTIAAGTLKHALQGVISYIPDVAIDPAQVDGPSLSALKFDDVKVEEVLNYLTTLTGYIWEITHEKLLRMYIPGTLTAPFNITVPNSKAIGDVIVEPTRQDYANRVIVRAGKARKQADDAAQQASHGLWEVLVAAPDDTPEDVAQSIADTYLAKSTPVLKRARYRTRDKGLAPGQTQIINLPTRNINNTFLIDDVVMRPDVDDVVRREVTATEGLVYKTGWRETYKRWNGMSSVAGAVGFGGGSLVERNVYPLGGSGVEAVMSATPDWVPVQGGSTPGTGSVQVQVNTVARGTTAAIVTARVRALNPGVSVKLRLYDVTDSVACPGESASVTPGTAWQTVTFNSTLTSGSHFYELQVLPGGADQPVWVSGGYLE